MKEITKLLALTILGTGVFYVAGSTYFSNPVQSLILILLYLIFLRLVK